MSRIRRISLKSKIYVPVTGSSPGSMQIYEGALKPQITIYSFKLNELNIQTINSFEEIDKELESYPGFNFWIDIRGIGDIKLLEYLQNKFSIDKLVMEDVTDCRQRPKFDEFNDFLFTVSRNMYVNDNLEIENEQVSFILLPHVLISFQETYALTFEPVIHRLKVGKGNIRAEEASYLLYALLDIIVDNYFSLIYKLGDELETIEQLLYRRADKALMFQTQNIKREMIIIRRALLPERDKINDMIRTESGLINKTTKTFLKDTYDHCMQVIDLIESYRDLTTSLIDVNISLISHRMNEIMKVLTIISSIFIPLTFVAGIYGMNFRKEDPISGKIMKNNMPELYMEYGYFYILLGMLLIAIIQMIYFWRKGWLNKS
jgi:magnesium transporter